MSNASDFIIENGVLKAYRGSGGNVVIPVGVTSVSDWGFFDQHPAQGYDNKRRIL